ncbi:hypothetical protein T07_13076 [Trichinella nelsoni]|uniref:Uncharacterized protein n=1 Tax=Trichinella nelsoni TaxID=6336 RepID=A0A0V0RX63_9BILA|nr:hypothetical protein T07_13076 [Trichinella nelsoni]
MKPTEKRKPTSCEKMAHMFFKLLTFQNAVPHGTACVLFFSLSYGIYETRMKKVLSFAQITCFTAASAILACKCVKVIVLLLLLLLASYVHFNSELVVVSSMTTSPLLKSIEFSVQSDLFDTSEHQLRTKMALRLLLQYILLKQGSWP